MRIIKLGWLLVILLSPGAWTPANSQGLPGRYHSYIELRSILSQLRDAHADIIRLDTMGYSQRWQIPILRIRISSAPNIDQDKPAIFICGGAHANEVLGPEVILGFTQDIVQRYSDGDQQAVNLVNSLEIFLVPMINPEGHVVVENGNLDWRKNQCDNDNNGVFNFHDGVDNNRNYDIGWELANDLKSLTPESSQYRGVAPFTQAENIAMRDFGLTYRPVAALDYHSPAYGLSEVVYYPWYWRTSDGGNGAAPDEPMMLGLARQFASMIPNDLGDSTYRARRGIVSEGDFNTYFYGNFGSVVFTVELSDTTIQDPSMVDSIVTRNLPSIYFLASRSLQGRITGVVRDSVTLEPLEAEVRVMERTNPDINPRMSRPDFGRYDRILGLGTYTLGFFKSGYYPLQVSGVTVGNSPVTRDVLLVPFAPRPPAPILEYPGDGQTLSENQFTFDWSDVALANGYLFELAVDSAFSSITLSDSGVTLSQFAFPYALQDGQYYWRVKGQNANGWGPYAGRYSFVVDSQSAIENEGLTPKRFGLSQNYPNPFNARTTIEYSLPGPSRVSLDIFDLLGSKIKTLAEGIQSGGGHQATWDASSQSSGIYFYRLRAGSKAETKKMVLIR